MQPRDEKGRLVPVICPDQNCGGVLVHEIVSCTYREGQRHQWRCDGLTYEREGDPLVACPREIDGPYIRSEIA